LITRTHALLVYDTLFAPAPQQRVHPQMVEKFARDEDGTTWHFELRDGLGWHDGTAVTARDCVASIPTLSGAVDQRQGHDGARRASRYNR
jgi:peptide/nickel transport system substrate-binding protein